MSTRHHRRDQHPARLVTTEDHDPRPPFMSRAVWDRLTPEQRAETAARAGTGRTASTWPGTEARAAENSETGAGEHPSDPGLSEGDLAILRPLGKLAAVHNMAERLGLPTPDRPRPTTTTTEEAQR
ncbi:hypothetical protein [Brachybacterium tyrofermentans]|uniref:hypothetical protein n=1 Tax=Brachybacterium tyrofermentans TaxID=47848 RepID=UPI003FD59A40